MSIKFTFQLPDEPFKNTFDLNKTIECTYTGPRYLLFRQDKASSQLLNVEFTAEKTSDIDLTAYPDQNFLYTIIDAYQHPLEASFLTHYYTNEDYEDYKETLPTGEEYVYFYDPNSILHVSLATQPIYYSVEQQFFSKLKYLEPAFTREQFDEIVARKIEWAEEIIKFDQEEPDQEDKLSEEKLKEIEDYLNWLKNINVSYSNVDHWKIPFPPAPII